MKEFILICHFKPSVRVLYDLMSYLFRNNYLLTLVTGARRSADSIAVCLHFTGIRNSIFTELFDMTIHTDVLVYS